MEPEVKKEAPVESPYVPETVEPKVDLEKLRNEKCIPVAHAVIDDMVENLLPTEETGKNYMVMVTNVLKKSLEADLNVTTEASYIPQLILGAFTGLNLTVQACDTTPIDEARYAAIGKKILSMVAEAKVRLTNVKPEDTAADFAPIKEKINALFTEEKLNIMEVRYIMDNIFDSFKIVDTLFKQSLDSAMQRAEAKVFGIEHMTDLTLKHLDGFLTREDYDATLR